MELETTTSQRIVKQKRFRETDKPHHWLGPGAYFYEEAPLLAWEWALRCCAKEPLE